MWTLNDAQERGWLNRAIEIYILLSRLNTSKAFGFHEHREGWRPDDQLGGLIYSCPEERENGKELRMLSQREGLCLGTGDLQRRKEGAQGLAPPLCLGVSHRLTSC